MADGIEGDLQSRFAATANRQHSSSFFSLLPPEIRRIIYTECWRHNELHSDARDQTVERTLKHHVFRCKTVGELTHSPCVVSDQNAHDFRYERLATLSARTARPSLRMEIWTDRIESDWAVHWPCEEVYKRRASRKEKSPDVFMYIEALSSIYSSVTFVLTDTDLASSFLLQRPPSTLRSLELCLRIPSIIPDLYSPNPQAGPPPSLPRNFPFDATNNPWARLCTSLARCTALRSLSIWLDHKNLGIWGERVHERAFLEGLNAVRARSRSDFLLALPEIRRGGGARVAARWRTREEADPGRYVEGSYLDDLPFVVVRGPRPDYWDAHLLRVANRRPGTAVLTIDPPYELV